MNAKDKDGEIYCESCYGKVFGPKGYGFGGGGGVGLRGADVKEEGTDVGSAGIDAEIQRKLNLKYDEEKERNIREWLESLLNDKFEEKTLQEALRSGDRLCKAVNLVAPGIVKKVNKSKFAAMQRENIASYLAACKYMAFNKAVMFETSDLYDGRNMVLVIENLGELAVRAKRRGGLPALKENKTKGGYDITSVYSTPQSSTTESQPESQPETQSFTQTDQNTMPSESDVEGTSQFCPDCGAPRDGGSKFCADCGHQFEE